MSTLFSEIHPEYRQGTAELSIMRNDHFGTFLATIALISTGHHSGNTLCQELFPTYQAAHDWLLNIAWVACQTDDWRTL